MEKRVVNNKSASQLELYFDDVCVGRVEYTLLDEYIDFKFIFVDPNYRGQKIALKLAQMANDYLKELNTTAVVTCGVLHKILKDNEEFNEFNWK